MNTLVEDYAYILICQNININDMKIENERELLNKYKDEYKKISNDINEYNVVKEHIINTINDLKIINNNITHSLIKMYNQLNNTNINKLNDTILSNLNKILSENSFLIKNHLQQFETYITNQNIIKIKLNMICKIYNYLIIKISNLCETRLEIKDLYMKTYSKCYLLENIESLNKRLKCILNTKIEPSILDDNFISKKRKL